MPRRARILETAQDDREFFEAMSDIFAFAEDLPEKYLECRELGHLWRPWTAISNPDGGFDRTLRCTRCTCKRIQVLSGRGVVLRNYYEHPEGYLHKGMGRIEGDARGALRLASVRKQAVRLAESNEKRATAKRKAS